VFGDRGVSFRRRVGRCVLVTESPSGGVGRCALVTESPSGGVSADVSWPMCPFFGGNEVWPMCLARPVCLVTESPSGGVSADGSWSPRVVGDRIPFGATDVPWSSHVFGDRCVADVSWSFRAFGDHLRRCGRCVLAVPCGW